IFRELAITYLGRHDLAHVAPDDLRGDALHDADNEPEFGSDPPRAAERPVAERPAAEKPVAEKPAAEAKRLKEKPRPIATARSGPLNRLRGNGHSNGNGHGKNGNGGGTATAGRVVLAADEKIRLARLKGYEGDPCPECGQLTLVRSGACCKCDTCGATSGC